MILTTSPDNAAVNIKEKESRIEILRCWAGAQLMRPCDGGRGGNLEATRLPALSCGFGRSLSYQLSPCVVLDCTAASELKFD